MIKCEIDGQEFKNGGVLARYLKRTYKITYKEYYHKYIIKSDDIPKCGCGCGENCNWANGIGYRKYKPSRSSWIIIVPSRDPETTISS
jgi:predicted transcriptional regulator